MDVVPRHPPRSQQEAAKVNPSFRAFLRLPRLPFVFARSLDTVSSMPKKSGEDSFAAPLLCCLGRRPGLQPHATGSSGTPGLQLGIGRGVHRQGSAS